jgi:hypothetical protein
MIRKSFFFGALVVGALTSTVGCERLETEEQQQESIVREQPEIAETEQPAAANFVLNIGKGDLDNYLSTRRGALKALDEDTGAVVISTDTQNDSGAYVALKLPEAVAAELLGKRIALEVDASATSFSTIQLQYNTMPLGKSPWVDVNLDPTLSTHLVFIEAPEDTVANEGAMVFIRAAMPETVFTIAGLRIGYAN